MRTYDKMKSVSDFNGQKFTLDPNNVVMIEILKIRSGTHEWLGWLNV